MNLSAVKETGLPFRFVLMGVLIGAIVTGCSERRSEQYRLQGDAYLRLQKYEDALEAYQNAANVNPENVLVQLGLGRSLAMLGRQDEALEHFRDALRIAPDSEAANLETAGLLMALGRTDDAAAAARNYEAADPEKGGVLYASVLRQSGELTEALSQLTELRSRFPDSALVRDHLASALIAAGQPAEAGGELAEPATMGAQILMADAMARLGRIDEVIADYEAKSAADPESSTALAHALFLANRPDEAEPIVRERLESNPSSGWGSYVLGRHLMDQGDRAAATPLLRIAASELPWEPAVMFVTTAAAETSGVVTAQGGTAGLDSGSRSSSPAVPEALDWQTLWQQASLRRLVDERARFGANAPPPEVLVLSACFLDDRKLAETLKAELPADSPVLKYVDHLLASDVKAAVDALEPWLDDDESRQIMAMNGRAYAMSLGGARNAAIQTLIECSRRFPDDGVSMFNIAKVSRSAQMPEFAAHAFRALTARFPNSLDARLMTCQMLREANMRDAAREAAEAMYVLFPTSREAAFATSTIYIDDGRLDSARQIVEAYLASHAEDSGMQMHLASIALHQNRPDEALGILERLELTDPTLAPAADAISSCAHAMQKNWQQIADTLAGRDLDSAALPTRFMLAAAQIAGSNRAGAAEVLVNSNGDEHFGSRPGAIVLAALGTQTLELNDEETALATALASNEEALTAFAAGVAFRLAGFHDAAFAALDQADAAMSIDNRYLLGLLYACLGNVVQMDDVPATALRLAESHPNQPGAWIGVAGILQQQGDIEGVRAALDRAVEAGPDETAVYLRRADFFANQKELDAAIAECRRLLELEPDHAVGNNNLAYYLLLVDGDPADALEAAMKALQQMPQDPHVLHTVGLAQLETGALEASRENLQLALERMPGEPSLLLDYGKLHIAAGETDAGYMYIRNALNTVRALNMDFDREDEAEAILAAAA